MQALSLARHSYGTYVMHPGPARSDCVWKDSRVKVKG